MINTDILIRARWIVPIEPDGVLENHAVAIQSGRIVDIVPTPAKASQTQAEPSAGRRPPRPPPTKRRPPPWRAEERFPPARGYRTGVPLPPPGCRVLCLRFRR